MDKLASYRDLIKRLIGDLERLVRDRPPAEAGPAPDAEVETARVFDDERGHYLLVKVGWAGDRRVRGATLHVRLRGGKIWIEEDWTEDGLATDLVKAGVPREDIVLGFQPPRVRPATEFAVA